MQQEKKNRRFRTWLYNYAYKPGKDRIKSSHDIKSLINTIIMGKKYIQNNITPKVIIELRPLKNTTQKYVFSSINDAAKYLHDKYHLFADIRYLALQLRLYDTIKYRKDFKYKVIRHRSKIYRTETRYKKVSKDYHNYVRSQKVHKKYVSYQKVGKD